MRAFFAFLLFGCILISPSAFSQCEVKYDAEVTAASAGTNGSIHITITTNISGPIKISLHDLMEHRLPVVQEKTVQPNELKNGVTFSGLKPTTYIIQVGSRNCSRTIGGPGGFKVDTK